MLEWGANLFVAGLLVFCCAILARALRYKGKLPKYCDTVIALIGVTCGLIGIILLFAKALGS